MTSRVAGASVRPTGWYSMLLATATIGISNSVVFSLLSNLQDEFGFGDVGLGLIAGSGFVVGLIGQLVFAPFADRGHSKRLLLLGLGVAVLGSIAFTLAGSLVTLVLARCVVGLSTSLFLPSVRAIVISVGDDGVARRLGVLGGVELAGFVTGPTIGGLLVGPYGLDVPFYVTGAFALGGLILLAPRDLPAPPISAHHGLAFDLLGRRPVRAGILVSVALFVPVGFYDAILDRYLTDLGAGDVLIGLSFLLFGIPFALLAPLGGRLADHLGPMRGAVITGVLITPLTVAYGFIDQPGMIVALSAVEGSIQALGIPAAQAAVARAAPVGRAGAAQGLAGASNLLIGATTAFAAGPIYQQLGSAWVFAIAGAGVLAFALLGLGQSERRSVS